MADVPAPSAPRGPFGRLNLEIREHMSAGRQMLVMLAGVAVGLFV